MKRIAYILLLALGCVSAQAQTSSTNCELLLISADESVPSYAKADSVIEDIYAGTEEKPRRYAGQNIKAIACTRVDIIPTLRDLPLIKTGLPLALSTDFDAPGAVLLLIKDDGKAYIAESSGQALDAAAQKSLDDILEIFNLQRLAE